jgi:hypothetical protein
MERCTVSGIAGAGCLWQCSFHQLTTARAKEPAIPLGSAKPSLRKYNYFFQRKYAAESKAAVRILAVVS